MFKFEVSGQAYEIDLAPEKLMGDELLLLEDKLPTGWAQRWASLELGPRDIVVLTYIAAKRVGEARPFDEFVKTIAPLTFQEREDKPAVQPRAKAKTAPAEGALGPMVRKVKAKSAAGKVS
jgi:hypothetical protein